MSITETLPEHDTRTWNLYGGTWTRVEGDGRLAYRDHVGELLFAAAASVAAGDERTAVRVLLRTTNEWMHDRALVLCESLLRRANPEKLGAMGSIGLLAALDPVRDDTRNARHDFTTRLRAYLTTAHPTEVDELMQGIR